MRGTGLPWLVKGDIDGFFGLWMDNLVQLLLIVSLLKGVLGFPDALIFGQVLPAAALSILGGNLFYAWQAHRLAEREGRDDVTALPYGINTVSLFAFVFFVMLPVKISTGSAEAAWRAGIAACFVAVIQHFLDQAHGSVRPIAPGFVDSKNVGDFHDTRLGRLNVVAPTRLHHEDDHIGEANHLDLGLTNADRFKEDYVPAHGVDNLNRLAARHGEPAQMPPRGHAADEHAFVGEMAAHANAVAQNRAAREGARRIDGQDAHAFPLGPKSGDQLIGQRAFPHARGARERDDPGRAPPAVKGFQKRSRCRIAILDPADEPGRGE